MENKKVKDSFIVGDEWIFYKLYCGYKSSDIVLVEAIKPIADELFKKNIIDKFFYIRYSDPELHLRVRFHFTKKENVGIIINTLNSFISKFVASNIIHDVVIAKYVQEIKRYGRNTIEISETIFSYESMMLVDLLKFLSDKGDMSEHIRWKFGLKGIDQLFDDFNLDINEKVELITSLRDVFNKEFNVDKFSKKMLDNSYRERRKEIEDILNNKSTFEYTQVFNDLLLYRSKSNKSLIDEILILEKNNKLQLLKRDYLASLSHMFLNRLFRSNQRAQEMVLYNYLWKYYDSVLAKQKYIKQSVNLEKLETVTTA